MDLEENIGRGARKVGKESFKNDIWRKTNKKWMNHPDYQISDNVAGLRHIERFLKERLVKKVLRNKHRRKKERKTKEKVDG